MIYFVSFHELSHTTAEQTKAFQSFSRLGRDLRLLQNDKQWVRRGQWGQELCIPQEPDGQVPYTNEAKQLRDLFSTSQWMPVTKYYRVGSSSFFIWKWSLDVGNIYWDNLHWNWHASKQTKICVF